MEDAFALVVLTLLQLCRCEISQPEWFAANVINDQVYTPKPITDIFTSDLTGTPKNPALFTEPTSTRTPTLPPVDVQKNNSSGQNRNMVSQPIGLLMQQMPKVMSQIVEDMPKTDLPNFVIVFDPRGQGNPNLRPTIMTIPPTQSAVNNSTTSTVDKTLTQSTPIPPTQGPIAQMPGNFPENLQLPNNFSSPTWPFSMLVYPVQLPNTNVSNNSTIAPVTAKPTTASQPVRSPKPFITVRVKSVKGSSTKIRINPTTTVRPLTTRRRKSTRKSNNYEACTNSCTGRKEPICSSPVGLNPIDPDKLKGFASLCHMVCHNSFRKEPVYEKVTDGRCGRLRTRIRPVDKNKLNRDELNKAQYTIVHNAPETVVKFSPLRQ